MAGRAGLRADIARRRRTAAVRLAVLSRRERQRRKRDKPQDKSQYNPHGARFLFFWVRREARSTRSSNMPFAESNVIAD
jgi:hypothetical protein